MSLMFELPTFPLLFSLLLFVFMLVRILYLKTSNSRISKPRLPPGPWQLPLFGNLHQMIGGLPNVVLRNLALKHGPIMCVKLGEANTIIISSTQLAEEVLKTNDVTFAQRPKLLVVEILSYNLTSLTFARYGHYWRQVRKSCVTELLGAKRVQSFSAVRENEGANFMEYIYSTQGKPFNFSRKVFSLFNSIIFRTTSGKKCKYEDEFISLASELDVLASGFALHDIFPSVKCLPYITGARSTIEKYHKRIDNILNSIIDDHLSKRNEDDCGEEDLLDLLLKIEKEETSELTLTMENIKAIILDMFASGGDSQATVLDWVMSELMRHPKVLERAQAEVREALKGKAIIRDVDVNEIPYLKALIKEILRMHPPTPLALREAREDCEISGYNIPRNTQVIINIFAMLRDPTIWPNPDSFEPERFLGSSLGFTGTNIEYIPFGAGRRMCPAILFALANLEFMLAKLLYHFDWKLPDGINPEELNMTEIFGATSRRNTDLFLTATPFIIT